MSEAPKTSRKVQAFAHFVRILVYYGWIPLIAILLIAWLLRWGTWREILAIGIAGALLIILSPMALGVVAALDSRHRNKQTSEAPPDDSSDG